MDKVQKIREGVVGLLNNHDSALDYEAAIEDVLSIIDSMQEEPVSDDLEAEIQRYYVDWDEHPEYVQTARHFAKWQKDHPKRIKMTDELAQTIYNDAYRKGQDDLDAQLRIGKVYANNEHMRHLKAVRKLVEQNPKYSDEYKRGKIEAIDMYIGLEKFNYDVDKMALRKTAEEQARIIRNRIEQRYREAVEKQLIDRTTYLQITAALRLYQGLFFAGFNVGLGELVGPQKITLNKED